MKIIKHLLFIGVFSCVFVLASTNNANALSSTQIVPNPTSCQMPTDDYWKTHTSNFTSEHSSWFMAKMTNDSKDWWGSNPNNLMLFWTDGSYANTESQVLIDYNTSTQQYSLSVDTYTTIPIYLGPYSPTPNIFGAAGSSTGHNWLNVYTPYIEQVCAYGGNIVRTESYNNNNPEVPPSIDLIYQVNMSLSGSGSNFIAKYNGKTTDPTSDLLDPTTVRWNITDYNINDVTSPVGTKLMCETVDKPISENFTNTDCSFTRITGHRYAVIMGVFIGNATFDDFEYGDNIYNITYKMSSIELLNQNGIYNTDTTTCINSTVGGEIGFGNNCNSTVPGLQSFLDDCINENFPFIHVVECGNALYQTINILTFGHINFGNSFVQAPDCRQLVMLDDWLLLPDDYVLCPQFPSYIRDTITPFITLFLGTITVFWLGGVKSKESADV